MLACYRWLVLITRNDARVMVTRGLARTALVVGCQAEKPEALREAEEQPGEEFGALLEAPSSGVLVGATKSCSRPERRPHLSLATSIPRRGVNRRHRAEGVNAQQKTRQFFDA